jgi:hypothetical protein
MLLRTPMHARTAARKFLDRRPASRLIATPRPASWPARGRGGQRTNRVAGISARSRERVGRVARDPELWRQSTGQRVPGYEAIAARARVCRNTVCEAIKALQRADVLTWAHCIARVRVFVEDLLGKYSPARADSGLAADHPTRPKSLDRRLPAIGTMQAVRRQGRVVDAPCWGRVRRRFCGISGVSSMRGCRALGC